MSVRASTCGLLAAIALSGCTAGKESASLTPAETSQRLYREGHMLYVEQEYDSAAAVLKHAAALAPAYVDPRADLADLYYTLAMKERDEASPARQEALRQSRRYFGEIESMGRTDADVYERLCELAIALHDDKGLLFYAKKNVELYPYDRQYYNLGIAYFNAGQYQEVVKSQKEAIGKFGSSPLIGGFYRQTGRAYAKMDRDQTAERTFEAGLRAVDERLKELKRRGGADADGRRLRGDRIDLLLELRHLYRTYGKTEKLREAERQLKEAGYNK